MTFNGIVGISVLSVVFLWHCVIILRRNVNVICSVYATQSSGYVGLDCYLGNLGNICEHFSGDFSFVYFASLICTDVIDLILKFELITGL